MFKKRILAGFMSLTILVSESCSSNPNPNTPVVVTSSWVTRTRSVISSVRRIAPRAKALIRSLSLVPASVLVVVEGAIDGVIRANEFLATSLDSWESHGGSRCGLYSAAQGLRTAILNEATVLAENGLWIGIPMRMIADTLFSVLDVILPSCEVDAGFRSIGRDSDRELDRIRDQAYERGIHLRNDLDSIE